MEAIDRIINGGILIESVNIVRATMNEADEIKDHLLEDVLEHKRIIMDLRCCEYIDSTFFGALVYAYRRIREQNGIIVILMSDTFIARSFIYRDIKKIFNVYFTIREAIDELNKNNKTILTTES